MTDFELISIVALWVAFLVLLILTLILYRQFGLLFVAPVEQLNESGIPVDTRAPPITVHEGDGAEVRLDWTSPAGLGHALVFGLPNCPVCTSLMPDLAPLTRKWPSIAVTYVRHGSPETDWQEEIETSGTWRFLHSPDGEAHEAFQVVVAPFAFVIDRFGDVRGKGLVNSGDAISGMLIEAFLEPSVDEPELAPSETVVATERG